MPEPPIDSDDAPCPQEPPRRPLWRRRWVRIVGGGLIVLVIVVGPWPAYEGDPDGPYARTTRARLDEMPLSATTGPVLAAVASARITPPVGEPLAGYSARSPMASDALADELWAKALSLSNGKQTVTIVGGDILLMLPHLRDAILRQAAVPRREVYFTATHTHSGPGGYSPRWLTQITLGEHDEAIVESLAGAFAEVITRSRTDMKPARIAAAHAVPTPGLVANRMDKAAAGNSSLACLSVLGADGRHVGGLVTFNAHPTCLGRRSRLISADYPGVVQRGLEKRFGGTWLFAAGAVGSMKPATVLPRGPRRLEEFGRKVLSVAAALSAGALEGAREEVSLACGILAVDLPQIQYRISSGWRLSPIITSLIHDHETYIHVVRINSLVLLGMPGDYSGELSARLERRVGAVAAASGGGALIPVITSFNGDYIGYLIPHDRYSQDRHESRDANFFGPWCGEYFHDLSVRIIKRLAE